MNISPEFRRNCWLELSQYRLISMPLILTAVVYLAYVSDDYRMADAVSSASAMLFFLVSMIWGTKLASESIMNEIRDHTWDGQRMSVITPWQLTMGKLFGSTVYSWYGAIICVCFYGISATGKGPFLIIKTMLVLLLSGVFAQAVSLLASLMAIQKERKFNKSQTAAILILGIVVAGPFFSMALGKDTNLEWYGFSCAGIDLLLGSILAYALWAIVGVYQLLRLELQMKNAPWSWCGFVLFTMVYFAGYFHGVQKHGIQSMATASPALLAAFCVSVVMFYFMAFAERKDLLTLRTVVRMAAAKDWRRFPERAPRWLLTLPITAVSGGAVIITTVAGNTAASIATACFVIATLLFMLRDMGILLFANFGRNSRRADMLSVLYLVLLYGIIPATLSAMKSYGATALFWPRPDLYPIGGCIAVLLEVILMAALVKERWERGVAE